MNDRIDQNSMSGEREMIRGLRDLGNVSAPPSLVGTVLAGVGLADAYWVMESPIGRMYVAYNSNGISAIMRAENDDAFEQAFHRQFRRRVVPVEQPPKDLVRRVQAQLRGEKVSGLSYDLRKLTEFERAVLLKALEIPRGEVRPYGWIAREIGHPRAIRAVGTALANNPVPLLIPCHRVVRSDGSVGKYAFGPEAKRALLEHEGVQLEDLDRRVGEGVRYFGSDTTSIFCYPTCRHARRILDRHRVTFRSASDAAAAGYRPCRVCRPA